MFCYLALLGWGWRLRLGMFVDARWRGPRGARGVALTFDDGPHPEHTPRVLDLLGAAGVRASFFVIGAKAAAYPELAREIVRRGHLLGVHGYHHDRLLSLRTPRQIRADLARCVTTLEGITGVRTTLFRPPVGLTSPRVAAALQGLGLTVIGYTVRGRDGWAAARPDEVARRVEARLEHGAIVQLHDAAEHDDYRHARLEALPGLLATLKSRGLHGVRLDEWPACAAAGQAAAKRWCKSLATRLALVLTLFWPIAGWT